MSKILVDDELRCMRHSKRLSNNREKGKFKTKYGYFSDDGREYVVTRPDTPKPWINVISNGDYGTLVSQTGSGFSWRGNANLFRLTRWQQDLITDEWGKYVYIRDNESRRFWSLGWKPVCVNYDSYECRHGIGYTTITNTYNEIRSSMTLFVPPYKPMEIWKVTLKNISSKTKKLSLFSYLEWQLGNWDSTHREFNKIFVETEYNRDYYTIFSKRRKQLVPGRINAGVIDHLSNAFHTVNIKPVSFEGDKKEFVGMYRSLKNPMALEKDCLSNTVGKGYDPIASLHVNLELRPGEEKTVIFMLGEADNKQEAKTLIKKYGKASMVDNALYETKVFWDNLLGGLKVETPDEAFNFMTNIWLKYQAISCRLWARTAYYQSSGAYGFRDQLQDSLIFLPLDPAYTRKQILLHAQHQFVNGTVYHWWHPNTDFGVKTGITDDLLWLVYVTLNYLEETNDFTILKEKVKYIDAPKQPLYEHCLKAIDKVFSRFSSRGLPLIGEGDWNDGMSRVGLNWRGESIWLAHFLYSIVQKWAVVIKYEKNLEKKTKEYLKRAEKLKKAINRYAWDGEWYIRATRDDGIVLGSAKCKEGKIFLNAQTWAIIAGTATEERANLAMEKVEEMLDCEYGPLLFSPAYTIPDEGIGYLSSYAPGVRENGGLYSHAACWAIMAECILGKGNIAYKMYSKMCPINRGKNPQLYCVEPYVMPGNVDGPDSSHFGQGGWTWYTGSAAWIFRVSTEWILGVRPGYKGLIVDPCIPKEWDGFRMKRIFRGVTYLIEVENPEHVEKGIKEIVLDGKKLSSFIIPITVGSKKHRVKVIMGKKS